MAATLAHIKSRELLPTPELDDGDDVELGEDGEDPRQELIRRLLDYQKYRDAAVQLGDRPVVGRNVWPRGVARDDAIAEDVDGDADAPLAEIPIARLIAALDRVLKSAKVAITHDITVDRLRVSDRINEISDRFEREPEFSFGSCFDFLGRGEPHGLAQLKHEVVVTFLAILEMAKLGILKLAQAGSDDEILLRRGDGELRERVGAADVSPDSDYQ
jgi:segregation and condensation protein A